MKNILTKLKVQSGIFLSQNREAIEVSIKLARIGISFFQKKDFLERFDQVLSLTETIPAILNNTTNDIQKWMRQEGFVEYPLIIDQSFLRVILTDVKSKPIFTDHGDYYIYNISGIEFILQSQNYHSQSSKSGIFVKQKEFSQFKDLVFDYCKKYCQFHLQIFQKSGGNYYGNGGPWIYQELTLPSIVKNNKYLDKVQKSLDKNEKRTFCFHGPPGTGKTTIVNSIVNHFKFKAIKLSLNMDMYSLKNLQFLVDNFDYDALIIEDIDHSMHNADLLNFLESVKDLFKIVLITANVLDELNHALKRPGRIDEIILVSVLDEDVVKEILGKNVHLFEYVKHMPVAYIKEIVTRINIYGPEHELNFVSEMEDRFLDKED